MREAGNRILQLQYCHVTCFLLRGLFFTKCQNLNPERGEVVQWCIVLLGWVEAMQGVGALTDASTSRYNGYKTQLSEIFVDRDPKKN